MSVTEQTAVCVKCRVRYRLTDTKQQWRFAKALSALWAPQPGHKARRGADQTRTHHPKVWDRTDVPSLRIWLWRSRRSRKDTAAAVRAQARRRSCMRVSRDPHGEPKSPSCDYPQAVASSRRRIHPNTTQRRTEAGDEQHLWDKKPRTSLMWQIPSRKGFTQPRVLFYSSP